MATLQKGDSRISNGWHQQWNGSKWVTTRKVSGDNPARPGQTTITTPKPGVDPLYAAPFTSQERQNAEAEKFVDKTTTPQSDIYAAGDRQKEGAKNIGLGWQSSQESLQKNLASALGAIAAGNSGTAGSNVYAGTQGAEILKSATPIMQGQALVSGTGNKIDANTRDLIQKNSDMRREAIANRLNELYKREVDKSSAREQSALTRESLGTKKDIAAATIDAQNARFSITSDIAYKKLLLAQQKLDSQNASPSAYLKQAGTTMRGLLTAKSSTPDGTIGHLMTVIDPTNGTVVRKWFAGNWQEAKAAAKTFYGPDLTDAAIKPLGEPQPNPSAKNTSTPKYTKEEVRTSMIKWIVATVPGYTRATAAAWVDLQPEMQVAR